MGSGASKSDSTQSNANTAVGVGMAPTMEVNQSSTAYISNYSPLVIAGAVLVLAIGIALVGVFVVRKLKQQGRRSFLRNYGVPRGYAERRNWRSRVEELGVDRAAQPDFPMPDFSAVVVPPTAFVPPTAPPSACSSKSPHASIPLPKM